MSLTVNPQKVIPKGMSKPWRHSFTKERIVESRIRKKLLVFSVKFCLAKSMRRYIMNCMHAFVSAQVLIFYQAVQGDSANYIYKS